MQALDPVSIFSVCQKLASTLYSSKTLIEKNQNCKLKKHLIDRRLKIGPKIAKLGS